LGEESLLPRALGSVCLVSSQEQHQFVVAGIDSIPFSALLCLLVQNLVAKGMVPTPSFRTPAYFSALLYTRNQSYGILDSWTTDRSF
jgi:hypothetical protein